MAKSDRKSRGYRIRGHPGRPRKTLVNKKLATLDAMGPDGFEQIAVERGRLEGRFGRALMPEENWLLHTLALSNRTPKIGAITDKEKAIVLIDHARQLEYVAIRNPSRKPAAGTWDRLDHDLKRYRLCTLLGFVRATTERERQALADHRDLYLIAMEAPALTPGVFNRARRAFREEKGRAPEPLSRQQNRGIQRVIGAGRKRERADADLFAAEIGNLPVLTPAEQGRTIARFRHRARKP